jgi:GNAT superfamily N-acetyltransferase
MESVPLDPRRLISECERLIAAPGELYRACKAIDAHPSEGTWNLVAARVATFYCLRTRRQFFYEPLSTYDQLLDAVRMNGRLHDAFVPKWMWYFPVVSFEIFETSKDAERGRLPLPRPGERRRGTHSVPIDGGWDDDGESVRFLNSWGAAWGDRGTGWLTREYADNFMVDAWVARDARFGPSAFTYDRIVSAADDQQFYRAWMQESPRWRIRARHNGRPHRLVVYETVSLLGELVEVLQIWSANGARLAWAHLHHVAGEPRTSVLKEFYVWPAVRRRGYGTLLDDLATRRARAWRSTALRVFWHEPDAQPVFRTGTLLFGERRGYRWSWGLRLRPPLHAIGEKHIDPDSAH